MGQKSTGRREPKWDNVRGILIILVVIGHIYENYNTGKGTVTKSIFMFIYLFHMPLFLFLSGMMSRRNIRERRWGNIFSMLALYFLTTFILGIARLLMFQNASVSFFRSSGVPWYALLLFIYQVLTVFADRLPRRYVMVWALAAGCMAGYDGNLGDFLALMRGFVFYPFFFAGYCADEKKLLALDEKKALRYISLAAFAGVFAVCLIFNEQLFPYIRLFTGRHTYETVLGEGAAFGALFRLGAYAISSVMGLMLIAAAPSCEVPLLTKRIGQRTLQIYTFHYVLVYLLIRKLDIGRYFKPLWPSHYLLFLIPVGLVITLACSVSFLGTFIDAAIHPLRHAGFWEGKKDKTTGK